MIVAHCQGPKRIPDNENIKSRGSCLMIKSVKIPAMFIVTRHCQTQFTLTKVAAGRSIE